VLRLAIKQQKRRKTAVSHTVQHKHDGEQFSIRDSSLSSRSEICGEAYWKNQNVSRKAAYQE
jgi:hypothetical protein